MDSLRIDSYDDPLYKFRNVKLDLWFPLGSLDISASREELSYDEETITAIKARLIDVKQGALLSTRKAIVKAANKLEVTEILREARISLGKIVDISKEKFTYKGNPIEEYIEINTAPYVKIDKELSVYSIDRTRWRLKALSLSNHKIRQMYMGNNYRPTDTIFIRQGEKETRVPSRLLKYINDNGLTDKGVVLIREDTHIFSNILTDFGITEWVDFADIPDIPKVLRSSNGTSSKGTTISKLFTLDTPSYRYTDKDCWTQSDDVVDTNVDSGYYVDLRNYKPVIVKDGDAVHDNKIYSSDKLQGFVRHCIQAGFLKDTDKVYGVPGSHKNILASHKNWKCLITTMRDKVEAYVKVHEKDMSAIADEETYRDLNTTNRMIVSSVSDDLLKDYRWSNPKGLDIIKLHAIALLSNDYTDVPSISIYGDTDVEAKLLSTLHTTYPMLKLALDNGYGTIDSIDIKTIEDYIRSINEDKGIK